MDQYRPLRSPRVMAQIIVPTLQRSSLYTSLLLILAAGRGSKLAREEVSKTPENGASGPMSS